ncbi:YTH domain-containing protein ECT4 isoform X1 [Arachis duranensis]|uniref:YTH domain-containing family protein n=1 Tax=Arachis duranensis TaxID=130453 RepID=A0A6P4D3M5_ARADU|nr:YTH domain-containing protein ECT4 isoform X1 [Arachis duranensis]
MTSTASVSHLHNSLCETTGTGAAEPNHQQHDGENVVLMKDEIPSDFTSVSSSEDVNAGFTDTNVLETQPCSSSVSTSAGLQNKTANGSVMAESNPNHSGLANPKSSDFATRNSYLTRTLLQAAADVERLNKTLRSNSRAGSLPRTCNNGKYSSGTNQRCHTFSPSNNRTNGSPAFSSANYRANSIPSVSSVNDRHALPPANNRTNEIVSTVNDRSLLLDKSRSEEYEMPTPLTRGPRGSYTGFLLQSSTTKNDFAITICRDKYNLPDFQTEYETAKFYVIKSFNEDDIHKSIKYDVWTSTSYGNKKLNDAFRSAEAKSIQTGTKCPIFLFFSVNASRQFVGVAEMLGPVDFNKDMKFWKLYKYNGFFPIRWHIIKDVPNTQFCHIRIIVENENRDVTYTRDTQEIGLKQGLEMLNIFKSYSAKTSLLDDFDFYENREKLLRSDKKSKGIGGSEQYRSKPKFTIPGPEGYGYDSYQQNTAKAGEKKIGMQSSGTKEDNIVSLTKQLSLNSSGK